MLLGMNCFSDCFVCVFFYIYVIFQILDVKIVVFSVFSVMCNVFVFFGIIILDKFYIFFICWCFVFDQKNKIYYFELVMIFNLFWLDLKKIDFSFKVGIKKLFFINGKIYVGDVVKDLKDSDLFVFLF